MLSCKSGDSLYSHENETASEFSLQKTMLGNMVVRWNRRRHTNVPPIIQCLELLIDTLLEEFSTKEEDYTAVKVWLLLRVCESK